MEPNKNADDSVKSDESSLEIPNAFNCNKSNHYIKKKLSEKLSAKLLQKSTVDKDTMVSDLHVSNSSEITIIQQNSGPEFITKSANCSNMPSLDKVIYNVTPLVSIKSEYSSEEQGVSSYDISSTLDRITTTNPAHTSSIDASCKLDTSTTTVGSSYNSNFHNQLCQSYLLFSNGSAQKISNSFNRDSSEAIVVSTSASGSIGFGKRVVPIVPIMSVGPCLHAYRLLTPITDISENDSHRTSSTHRILSPRKLVAISETSSTSYVNLLNFTSTVCQNLSGHTQHKIPNTTASDIKPCDSKKLVNPAHVFNSDTLSTIRSIAPTVRLRSTFVGQTQRHQSLAESLKSDKMPITENFVSLKPSTSTSTVGKILSPGVYKLKNSKFIGPVICKTIEKVSPIGTGLTSLQKPTAETMKSVQITGIAQPTVLPKKIKIVSTMLSSSLNTATLTDINKTTRIQNLSALGETPKVLPSSYLSSSATTLNNALSSSSNLSSRCKVLGSPYSTIIFPKVTTETRNKNFRTSALETGYYVKVGDHGKLTYMTIKPQNSQVKGTSDLSHAKGNVISTEDTTAPSNTGNVFRSKPLIKPLLKTVNSSHDFQGFNKSQKTLFPLKGYGLTRPAISATTSTDGTLQWTPNLTLESKVCFSDDLLTPLMCSSTNFTASTNRRPENIPEIKGIVIQKKCDLLNDKTLNISTINHLKAVRKMLESNFETQIIKNPPDILTKALASSKGSMIKSSTQKQSDTISKSLGNGALPKPGSILNPEMPSIVSSECSTIIQPPESFKHRYISKSLHLSTSTQTEEQTTVQTTTYQSELTLKIGSVFSLANKAQSVSSKDTREEAYFSHKFDMAFTRSGANRLSPEAKEDDGLRKPCYVVLEKIDLHKRRGPQCTLSCRKKVVKRLCRRITRKAHLRFISNKAKHSTRKPQEMTCSNMHVKERETNFVPNTSTMSPSKQYSVSPPAAVPYSVSPPVAVSYSVYPPAALPSVLRPSSIAAMSPVIRPDIRMSTVNNTIVDRKDQHFFTTKIDNKIILIPTMQHNNKPKAYVLDISQSENLLQGANISMSRHHSSSPAAVNTQNVEKSHTLAESSFVSTVLSVALSPTVVNTVAPTSPMLIKREPVPTEFANDFNRSNIEKNEFDSSTDSGDESPHETLCPIKIPKFEHNWPARDTHPVMRNTTDRIKQLKDKLKTHEETLEKLRRKGKQC